MVTVAKLLETDGCTCVNRYVTSDDDRFDDNSDTKSFKPVGVRFLGLFDAVAQQFTDPFGDFFETDSIPGNVKYSAALWRTKNLKLTIFPQNKYVGITKEHDFYLGGAKTSHSESGRTIEAAEWMIKVARNEAGVSMK